MVVLIMVMYLMFMLLYGGVINFIFLLFMMETLSWMFSFFLKELSFKYLLVQSFFFFMSIMSIMWYLPFLSLVMLLKVGLPPLHLWMFSFSVLMKKMIFFILMTLHKLFPLFFFLKVFVQKTMLFLLSGVMLFSSLFILKFKSIFYVLMLSSMMHSVWILLCGIVKISLMMVYWMFYSTLLYIMLLSLSMGFMSSCNESQSSMSGLIWLILSGLPPFTMFWLKVNVLMIVLWKSIMFSVLLVFSVIMSLVSYFRVFNLMMMNVDFFMKSTSCIMFMSLLWV